jgi:hypothetical protein
LISYRFRNIRYCYIRGKSRDKKRLPADLFCTTEREEELLTPIMAILGFPVVLATVAVFTGDGLTRFILTTTIKSPSEGFSSVTMDDSGRKFLAGAVTRSHTRVIIRDQIFMP